MTIVIDVVFVEVKSCKDTFLVSSGISLLITCGISYIGEGPWQT